MQNHRIPYTTATWGIVEDASEPAPFLSVVATRNGKWTRIFALIEQRSLEKDHKTKNTKEPPSRTRCAVLRDAAVSAKRNGKWILKC